ncbi:divergent PAP2 family protein [Feifania hominis]|uniref:Divergent PAP2 family protein n=1 Tax=Feifania hominis TaxID=2763660 RepID=A0A926HT64_9FIRM|nr:divergent PAP2 family protein [Feifania hominis]
MSNIVKELTGNYILNCAVITWAIAQILKVFTYLLVTKELKLSRLLGSGGMPSSHTAFVASATIAVYRVEGIHSVAFAIMFVILMVIISDAVGVRRQAGEHARVLNIIMENWEQSKKKPIDKNLKELLGHTPFEVFGGFLLAIIMAFFY